MLAAIKIKNSINKSKTNILIMCKKSIITKDVVVIFLKKILTDTLDIKI